MTKKNFLFLSATFLITIVSLTLPLHLQAQTTTIKLDPAASLAAEATLSAETTTPAAKISSPSAEVAEKIQEKKDQDITESEGKQKNKLVSYLEENEPGPLSWNNFIEHAIRYAVGEGVPPNIIVLVLLFPLVVSLIAASRHIIGLRGFGIYIPAVLSVAFVSTGILEGLIIFCAIALISLITKNLLRRTKLSYLPRTALLLWTVSIGIFGVLIAAPLLNLTTLMSVNIFPILILMLLTENFLDAQARTKQADALALTIETIGLAFISGLILKSEMMQKFALTEPELLIIISAAINFLIGKFGGLRITEWLRFRSLIEEE